MRRGYDKQREEVFFALFRPYFDAEKDAGKQHDPANYSLARMTPLLALADHPEQRLRVLHVAGTKGKGSTCHFIANLLSSAGRRVGLFTSPHLATVRERFEIDGVLLSYERLTAFGREFVDKVAAAGLEPSLFELFTVMAMALFVDDGVEYAVLETGIGGRLDATNVVPKPCCTVITPVSFDHMALLGNSIEAIAGEKAGILKAGVPLVLGKQPYAAAAAVIKARAAALGCEVLSPRALSVAERALLPAPCAPFLLDNFALALTALDCLGVTPSPAAFRPPELRARCEKISDEPLVLLDAAHNADSMEKLCAALLALYPGQRWTVVLGMVKGKDIKGMVQALRVLPAEFILTNPHTGKGSGLDELIGETAQAGLTVRAVIRDLQSKTELPVDRPLLFTGSFFTALIGEQLFNP
ncbi:MAG: bifunctional folylpolyglutamate synthase/dihydrofolate synthase [Lentisphaeria bacterium]|jgi:dihydrofolate synthase/folylpolyglutamate synthase